MLPRTLLRRPSASLVVALTALFVSLGGLGYAATGGSFVLGKANSADRTTRLTSSARGPALALKNTSGGAAASFSVRAGVAPFSVGSAQRVKRLNADLIDGIDSTGFYRSGSKVDDSDRLDGQDSTRFWNLSGNAGTVAGTDFLGTRDAQPLVVKTNNTEAMRVAADGSVSVVNTLTAGSTTSGATALTGRGNSRTIVGTLGASTCPRGPSFAVGGCTGPTSLSSLFGSTDSAVYGNS